MGWDDPDYHVECNGVPFQKSHMQSITCLVHTEAMIVQVLPIPFPPTLLGHYKLHNSFPSWLSAQ